MSVNQCVGGWGRKITESSRLELCNELEISLANVGRFFKKQKENNKNHIISGLKGFSVCLLVCVCAESIQELHHQRQVYSPLLETRNCLGQQSCHFHGVVSRDGSSALVWLQTPQQSQWLAHPWSPHSRVEFFHTRSTQSKSEKKESSVPGSGNSPLF